MIGVIPNGTEGVSADFQVDNNIFSRVVPGLAAESPALGNQVLFEIFNLGNGEHELKISNINASQDRQLIVQGFNLFFQLPPATESNKSGPNANLKVIISISLVGGLVLILLILFVFWYVRKRRLHRKSKNIVADTLPTASGK